MKKLLALCSVLALVAVVFAPSARACGNTVPQAASKKASSCSVASAKVKEGGPCIVKIAKRIKKCFKKDEAGNLTCSVSGEIYARAQKDGDEVVYVAGDKTYPCMYEAASATWGKTDPDETDPDEANPFDEIRFDKDGSILCSCCDEAIVKAKKNGTGTTYVAAGKDYGCAYEALLEAASSCKKSCRKKKSCRRRGRT